MRPDARDVVAGLAGVVGLALAFALTVKTPVEAQCAMCRRVLESGDGQALAAVLRQAIVLLLVTPFMLIGVIGTLAVRIQRRTHPRASSGGATAADLANAAEREEEDHGSGR